MRPARWLPRLIGPVILAYFLLTTDLNEILLNLRNLRWAPLLLSLALYPVLVAIKAWRWNLLLRNLTMQAPPLGYSTILYMIGLFLGAGTPGQAGDFIKAWYLRERGQPLGPALFSVLLDRLFDFLVMALLSLPGLVAFLPLLPPQLRPPVRAVTLGVTGAVLLLLPALMTRWSRDWLMRCALVLVPRGGRVALDQWRGQLAGLDLRPRLVAGLVLATFCSAATTMVRLALLVHALDIVIPIGALVSSMALVSILQSLPISFSGVGVRDAALIPVLAGYGYGPDEALALSALILLLNVENIALGFLASLRYPLGPAASAGSARADVRGR